MTASSLVLPQRFLQDRLIPTPDGLFLRQEGRQFVEFSDDLQEADHVGENSWLFTKESTDVFL